MRRRQPITLAALAIVVTMAVTAASASEEHQRTVSVNGIPLSEEDLAEADAVAGFGLPDGDYWYDPHACTWGRVGDLKAAGPAPCGGHNPPWQRHRGYYLPPPCEICLPPYCEGGECTD